MSFIDPIQPINSLTQAGQIGSATRVQTAAVKKMDLNFTDSRPNFENVPNSPVKAKGQVNANVNGAPQVAGTEQGAYVPFKSAFINAIKDVRETDAQVNIDAEMLATGKSDNLHQYSIDIAKAQLSLELLVEMRNKALDAYSEIMRMSV